MILEKLPNVQQLNLEDKVLLAEELLAQTGYTNCELLENETHKRILDERWEHYLQHPETALAWEDVRERMKRLRRS